MLVVKTIKYKGSKFWNSTTAASHNVLLQSAHIPSPGMTALATMPYSSLKVHR